MDRQNQQRSQNRPHRQGRQRPEESPREEGGPNVESTTVGVYRTAATIKGGRRFSFGALVVVGDRHGQVGIGYGKANEVPPAIEKAEKEAKRRLRRISLQAGTLPHPVTGRFGASKVRLLPAAPGTGVVAGRTVRAVLELAGVRDCLTKAYGSTNARNLVKATLEGLEQLRRRDRVEEIRGVSVPKTHVDEILELNRQSLPTGPSAEQTNGGGQASPANESNVQSQKAPTLSAGPTGAGAEGGGDADLPKAQD